MRTLHVGLRVADLDRSVAFSTCVGYEVHRWRAGGGEAVPRRSAWSTGGSIG